MPPKTIIALGQRIGFRSHDVYVRISDPIKMPRPLGLRDHVSVAMRVWSWLPRRGLDNSHVVVLRK